ncbi:RHS repeat-associated core domain-containing protein [Nonomuraea sp. KM90]|uniref:RHS repeat-associated core domain-containing protein n=1 Tax=Nonomuraea sp. KM90 TaxID=3457428 RepID=UPI003FCC804A
MTTSGVAGPWSAWQFGHVDTSKPTVSSVNSTGAEGESVWTYVNTMPSFTGYVTDSDGRAVVLGVEVEHDPAAAGQGSGVIWAGSGTTSAVAGGGVWLSSGAVPAGRLQDGWLIRWRVRGVTTGGVAGPWSQWQSAKVDTTKPAISSLNSTGTLSEGLWSYSTLTPSFSGYVTDPDGRAAVLGVEVEHDPAAAGQGSGVIWAGSGTTSAVAAGTGVWLSSGAVPSGRLQDGWLIRWRARGVATGGVAGPWSQWQTGKVEVSKPAGGDLGAVPATQGTSAWTLSSLTPYLYMKVTDSGGAASYLGAEIEHDPSVPAQGSGSIWAGKGTKSYASGSNAWVQVPEVKLQDGWLVRWRVQGVTITGIKGPWSQWLSARVDLKKPSVAGQGLTPATEGSGLWTASSVTPSIFATVTDPESRASYLGVEVEHDPLAAEQGSGPIYAGRGTAAVASGAKAWVQVPAAKLSDGWLVRWRVRAETTTGIKGPWSEWQSAKVDLKKPSVDSPGMDPAMRGTVSWTAATLTPNLYATVNDPENRRVHLGIEVEHDLSATTQGAGQIFAGTATTSYATGTKAWMSIPTGKLKDGWLIRWRVRAVTTTGVAGPWADWQYAQVSALPFETFSPANNSQVGSLTPILAAHARPLNEAPVTYWFQVCEGTQPNWTWCESSPGWEKSGAWKVPENKLTWGKTYWWMAKAVAGGTTVTSSWRTFTPTPEQGTINASLGGADDGHAFDHFSGNYTRAETDLSVSVVGPPLSVSRTYNSLDPRTSGAFGAGWSTRWDMRIDPELQTSTLLVTYPAGVQLRFAAKGDGTYASPSGMYATLATLPEGGWRLMDKSATSYWFDVTGRLTKVSDHRDRGQELKYGADGKLAKVTATGGRSLTFGWTGKHVTSVSTDPVDGTALTWTYTYDGDKLTKVCGPTQACTTYTHTDASRYRSIVLDAGPEGYWRLNETTTAKGAKIANSAGWNVTTEEATLTGGTADVVAGVTGALAGSSDTAMRFKGMATSGYVSLPPATISGNGGTLAVEAWFRTTGSGTIIGYQNSASAPSAFTPGIYVGTDGKLRGQFYTGAVTPITSSAPVNDGSWHHVVLSGAEDRQTLFLDGQVVGTLTGKITHAGQWETRIGSGHGSSAWPATTASAASFPFAGDIDEVAVYGKPLGEALVKLHYAARSPQPQLTKAVAPSGRVQADNVYAADGGRLTQHTDRHGGAWKLSDPVYVQETTVYTSATITVTDPHGGTLTYVDDVTRGNRQVAETDQLGNTTKYGYDVGGFQAKIVDPNGGVVEAAFNARGNLISKKTCRSANACSTEYYTYYVNVDDPFDPRNDLKTAFRDARSSSPLDEMYQTSWTFNSFGEQIAQTTPATPDFPQGRSTGKTYTDGTESAVGGGLSPAGLVKSVKDYKGNETTYAYTASGDLATETTRTGLVKKYEHDALGRIVKQTEISQAYPGGATTTTAYDAFGRIVSRTGHGVKNAITGVTHTSRSTIVYDADGLPLTETQSDLTGGDTARTISHTYDTYGRTETITGPEGGTQRFAYDHRGQKVSFTDERGTTYHYTYTPRGEWATTTLKGWTGSPVALQPPVDVVVTSNAYDPAGRLASETDAMGRTTAFTYYNDNLLAEKIAKGVKLNGSATARDVVLESRVYDAADQLIRQTAHGGTLRADAAYDAAGRLVSQTLDPAKLNRVTTPAYDANGNITKLTLTAAGTQRAEVSEYAYNGSGKLVRQVVRNDGQDLVTTFTVDDRDLVTAMTDPRGNVSGADPAAFTTDITYDVSGQPVQVQLPPVKVEHVGAAPATSRPTTKVGYNTYGDKTHQVDAEGRAVTSAFDRAGRVVEQTFPAYNPPGGQPIIPKVSAGYDAAGQLITSTDRRGQTSTAVYDALGRKVKVTAPKGGVWAYGYDLLGEALWTVDAGGARSESTYDDLGRQITLTTIERKPSRAAYVTRMEYDDAGRVTKTTRPTGDISTRVYDAVGALTEQADALGNTTTFGYDLAGRLIETTNPLGDSSTASYDLAGRKVQIQELDAGGAVLRSQKAGYDVASNPISRTSAEGRITTQVFDAANRLTELREPVSATETITSSFGYDATGSRTRSTDGRGNSTFTTYNTLGLAESVIEPSTAAHPNPADRTWTNIYDAGGNPVTSLIPGGVRVDRVFDELSRLTTQTGTGGEAATEDKTFGYDQVGRLIAANDLTFTLNDRGLLLRTTGAGGDLNAYAYDANNRPTQRVDITGVSSFTWDDADRLTQAVDPVSATTIEYGYDKASRLTSMAYGASGARRSYTYDPLNRLTKDQLTTSAGGAIASIEYGYDLDNNLTTKTTAGTAGAGTNTYTYDWSNRLTSWTAPDGKKTDYGWDAAGNRVKAGDATFTYDERNRLTSGDGHTYTYTARGTLAEDSGGIVRLTKSDAFDRLVQDDGVHYDYDGLDRVESRSQGQQITRHIYDGLSNNLVCVTDGSGVKQASFGRDALGRTLGISDGAGAQLGFSDLRGDLIGAFTADGIGLVDSVAYDPFGEVIMRTGAQHTLGYQGAYTDPDSGKVNMAARWYQPTTGSFVTRDTLTQNPDPSVQLNRYAYANANPLTNVDPDGHASLSARLMSKLKNMVLNRLAGFATVGGAGMSLADDEKKCPRGRKSDGSSLCNDARGAYNKCVDGKKGSKAVCEGMKSDYVECRQESRGEASKTNDKICSRYSNEYLTCRKGTETYGRQSHEACGGAGREVRRCMYGNENGSRPGYGQGLGGCENVRYDYYDCRLDKKRGDDAGCSAVSELYYRCKRHMSVACADLQDKFLSCYKRGRGGTVNECAFGVNMLMHCRDSQAQKVFMKSNTCSDAWSAFMKECEPLTDASGNRCTKGETWQDVSYTLCEGDKKSSTCVTYISPQDRKSLDSGGSLALVLITASLDICAATLGLAQPLIAGSCGVAKAVIDIINGVLEEIAKSEFDAALAGSKEHGEEGGIASITRISYCKGYKYTPTCKPENAHVTNQKYAPL